LAHCHKMSLWLLQHDAVVWGHLRKQVLKTSILKRNIISFMSEKEVSSIVEVLCSIRSVTYVPGQVACRYSALFINFVKWLLLWRVIVLKIFSCLPFSKEQLSVFSEFILFNILKDTIYLDSGELKEMWQICELWDIQTA